VRISTYPWSNISRTLANRSVHVIMRASPDSVRPGHCSYVRTIEAVMQNYRDLATSVWAAVTWRAFLSYDKVVWGRCANSKTLSGGSLGSCIEEEQSKLCDLL
jgi:hypothetical protein